MKPSPEITRASAPDGWANVGRAEYATEDSALSILQSKDGGAYANN